MGIGVKIGQGLGKLVSKFKKKKAEPPAETQNFTPAPKAIPGVDPAALKAPPPSQIDLTMPVKPGEQLPGISQRNKVTANQPGVKSGWVLTKEGWMPTGGTAGTPPAWSHPIMPQFQNMINQSEAARQAQFQAAIAQIQTTPTEQEAASAGISPLTVAKVGGKIAGGAAIGLAAGGGVTPAAPFTAAGGAAAMGLYSLTQLGGDAIQRVKEADTNRKIIGNNIKKIINNAEAGNYNATEAAIRLREEEVKMRQVQAVLKRETKTAWGADLSKGIDDLAKVNNYFETDAENYKRDLINALANPTGKVIAMESVEDLEVAK